MNTIFYLVIVFVIGGSSSVAIEKIPQKTLAECKTNSAKIAEAQYPRSVGLTTYCLSGVKN